VDNKFDCYTNGMKFNNVFIDWLKVNKITEQVQSDFNIQFDEHIIIPVYDENGEFYFNKYRRNPLSDTGIKYWYDKGGKVTLYGYHKAKDSDTILLTEGEKDCLVAWSHNIPAITSTGGANSFQKEWADLLKDKEIIICFDNDDAGANGMVRTLNILPNAKILLLPDMPNVKDISDYVTHGGNINELIKTAKHFNFIEEVASDRLQRLAMFKSVLFHDAYIKEHTKINTYTERKSFSSDKVTNAKLAPMGNFIELKANKCCCPFHNEKTPSFQYYPKTNTAYCFGQCGRVYDVIDVYRNQKNCTFIQAVSELNKLS